MRCQVEGCTREATETYHRPNEDGARERYTMVKVCPSCLMELVVSGQMHRERREAGERWQK